MHDYDGILAQQRSAAGRHVSFMREMRCLHLLPAPRIAASGVYTSRQRVLITHVWKKVTRCNLWIVRHHWAKRRKGKGVSSLICD